MNILKKLLLKNLLKKMDSLCGLLSSDYGYPNEAYNIRKIIRKIENE